MAKLVDSQKYKVIGLMSGTSLDGVDIAYCIFRFQDGNWSFSIEATQAVKYTPTWKKKLQQAHLLEQEPFSNFILHMANTLVCWSMCLS